MSRRVKMSSKAEKGLKDQLDFESNFNNWFNSKLKPTLDDNRRRYRMILEDEDERESRGLSTIPSVKSTSVVDRAVERALLEYHGEPDAITYTAKLPFTDVPKDELAKLLTEIVQYRMRRTFPFFTWHASSLTAGFTDGLEAAMVYWRKEAYKKKLKNYFYIPPPTFQQDPTTGEVAEVQQDPVQIDKMVYERYSKAEGATGVFYEEEVEEEVVTRDTWWVDSLRPGEHLLWDFKAPLLDINLGERALVKLPRTLEEIRQLKEYGVIDKYDEEKLKTYMRTSSSSTLSQDSTATAGDTTSEDMEDLNRIEMWLYFKKDRGEWKVCFSAEGEVELSKPKSVNDVFYGGRSVNVLPIAFGTHRLKLWEAIGRGEPETIAPIEDELTEHRNNVADASKISIQGRWRLDRDSDVDIDDLLNGRAFYAGASEVEKIDQQLNIIDSLRVADQLNQDITELIPTGMENKNIVPRGTGRTLGAVQIAVGQQTDKLSVQLITRNQTFFEKLLYLIAQMEMAYETDETIVRVAARKAGVKPPEAVVNGGMQVDFSKLDLDVDVQINAGLGSAPRHQKAQNIIQLADWRRANGVPTDMMDVARQLNSLAGFEPDAFMPQSEPPPPLPEINGNVNVDMGLLPPDIQKQIMEIMLTGTGKIGVNMQGIKGQNNKSLEDAGIIQSNGMEELGAPPPDPGPGGIEGGGQGGY